MKNVTLGQVLDHEYVEASTWLYYAINKPQDALNHPVTVIVTETNNDGKRLFLFKIVDSKHIWDKFKCYRVTTVDLKLLLKVMRICTFVAISCPR